MSAVKIKTEKCPLVNQRLTKRIIALHESGYVLDFRFEQTTGTICMEEVDYPLYENFHCCLVDQCFDEFSCSYRYLHTVETFCGRKGLLLSDRPMVFPKAAAEYVRYYKPYIMLRAPIAAYYPRLN